MPSKCLHRCKCVWEEDERTPEDLFLSVLNPHLSTNSVVHCGSWSENKDEQVLLEAFGGKDVELKIILPKTRKYTQPLDVYLFRQYKIYCKRITDFIKVRSSNMQPKLYDRFFIMKLHSVIYNQVFYRSIQTNALLYTVERWLYFVQRLKNLTLTPPSPM